MTIRIGLVGHAPRVVVSPSPALSTREALQGAHMRTVLDQRVHQLGADTAVAAARIASLESRLADLQAALARLEG